MEIVIKKTKLCIIQGDITLEETDAIVNAANTTLRGGGGVDGAIHRAGGQTILEECVAKYPQGCETGEARTTNDGLLKAKWIIHTPGPIWHRGSQNEPVLLENSYRNTFHQAERIGATSISYPSISTGIYGFPIQKAAPIAIETVLSCLPSNSIQEVHFVLFSNPDFTIYCRFLAQKVEDHS
ncbi:MAG: macro domain-containing protein [Candidatus Heimdallarchaeota archaeon]|nr:macro domain-containing protein [Candidatus Heimdallarchaeota archaeon]